MSVRAVEVWYRRTEYCLDIEPDQLCTCGKVYWTCVERNHCWWSHGRELGEISGG